MYLRVINFCLSKFDVFNAQNNQNFGNFRYFLAGFQSFLSNISLKYEFSGQLIGFWRLKWASDV